MKIFILLTLFIANFALADILDTENDRSQKKQNSDDLRQTYEGNIRGIRALMADLKLEQPSIYRKLKNNFEDLDARQSKADTIAYVAYGTSVGFAAYGFAHWFGLFRSEDSTDNSGMSFTPFLISLAATFIGGWAYYMARPSPQEYLDFTNKHNRLNKSKQLQWNISMDIRPKGASAGVTYRF